MIANTLDLVGNYGVPLLGFPPLYPTMYVSTSNPSGSSGNTGDSLSYFGEIYYDLTASLKLTVGLRYNEDRKEVEDTGILFNAVDVNALVGGVLGPDPVWTRTTGFLFGAPAGDLENFYAADLVPGASTTAPLSPERFAVSNAVPIAPGFGENRELTGSPSKAKFTETTGRIGLDWQISNNSMVYAFYTRGYKPGGFNPPLNETFVQSTTAKYVFDPEKVDAYEIGTKNVFLDGSLMVNGALFVYDYKGLQVTRIANNNSINDNMDADIWGAEVELFYRPEALPGLSVDLAYSYLNTEVSGTESVDPINRTAGDPDYILLENIDPGSLTGVNYVARRDQITPALITAAYGACGALSDANPNPACPPVAPGTIYSDGVPAYFSRAYLTANGVETNDGLETNLDGKTLPNSPEHTVHLGLAYTWMIPQIFGSLTARWDYYWQDESYAREFNTVGDQIDSWDQQNATLIYESDNGAWEGRLWVRNLTDDNNVTGKYLTADTSGFFRNYFLTEPRIYGATVRYNFDSAR